MKDNLSTFNTVKIFIPHVFTTLNEYIDAERTNKYRAANIKQNETEVAYISLLPHKKYIQQLILPLTLNFIWIEKDKRKDLDNVAFAKKFICDGLVLSKCLRNDGQKYINATSDRIMVNKDTQGVYVEFSEN